MSERKEELPLQKTENSYENIMIFFILNTQIKLEERTTSP